MATSGLSQIDGAVHVNGQLTARTMILPDGTVDDDAVAAGADILATKLQHQYVQVYSQDPGVPSIAETKVVHVVHGATGTIVSFEAGAVVAAGSATTFTVNLCVNGTSVLSAVISLTSADTAYTLEAASVSSPDLVQDDVLEVVVLKTTGTNEPQGIFAKLVVREDAQ